MFDRKAFDAEKAENIEKIYQDKKINDLALNFMIESDKLKYGYYWTWFGLPVIQMPEDIVITQEIIFDTKPDIIIEAGIAWGGGVLLYASMLQLLGKGKVLAVDKVLPEHNKKAIMGLPFSDRIHLYEGSSTDPEIVEQIKSHIKPTDNILLVLDSNHTHEHVYNELKTYAPLLKKNNCIIVSDTIVEEIPEQTHRPRPWGHGNNPRTAADQFLKEDKRFTRNNMYNKKAINSYTRNGYLMCTD